MVLAFIEAGAGVNARDNAGRTALCYTTSKVGIKNKKAVRAFPP